MLNTTTNSKEIKGGYFTTHKLVSLLEKKHNLTQAIDEIKILCFFAYETKTGRVDFSSLDFSAHDKLIDSSIKISNDCPYNVRVVINNITHSSTLKYCDELNTVFNSLLNLTAEDILYIMFDYDSETRKSYDKHTTDSSISNLLVELSKDIDAKSVLDICSGEGNILSKYYIATKNNNLNGIEFHYTSSLISKLKLIMVNENYDINKIINDDVLLYDIKEKYDLIFCDSNFGTSLSNDFKICEDTNLKISYNNILNRKADWSFTLKAINSISENGKAFILVHNAMLSNALYSNVRADIIENKFVEAIIQLPQGTLSNTSLGYSILVVSNNNDDIKLVNAQDLFTNTTISKKDIDVAKIIEVYNSSDNNYVYNPTIDEIRDNDYNLEPIFYIKRKNAPKLINPCKLGEIADVIPGYQYTSKNLTELPPTEGNVSIVKITNIHNGEIEYSDLSSANIEESKFKKYLLKENDILLSTRSTGIKLALVKNLGDRCVVPQFNLSIIRCKDESINPVYLYNFLSGKTGKELLEIFQKGSLVMLIGRKELLEMDIPLLSKETQELIAIKYNKLNSKIKELKNELNILENEIVNICEDSIISK